jgi:hypothetical protein
MGRVQIPSSRGGGGFDKLKSVSLVSHRVSIGRNQLCYYC